jgi:hypothetical protein
MLRVIIGILLILEVAPRVDWCFDISSMLRHILWWKWCVRDLILILGGILIGSGIKKK